MTGLLTDSEMGVVTGWIGAGPKTFTLLYKISKDGCNNITFHQKCDNQGPTLTVLYNQQNTVYGGYTSQSWTSRNAWVCDNKAFLFRLNSKGSYDPIQMPRNGNGNDVYDHSNYGPTFGNGYCLHTFSGSIDNSGGYFSLNGYVKLGNSYDFKGQQVDQINNNSMNVTDMEVYRVQDGERKSRNEEELKTEFWRNMPVISEKLVGQLEEDVVGFRVDRDLKFSQARIILVGPVGAGKSSLCNTINSIFRGRVTQKAISGSAEESLTTQEREIYEKKFGKIRKACPAWKNEFINYTQHIIRTRTGAKLNFRICDSRGLEETQGLDTIEYNYLLDGHIPNHYEFNPTKPITPGKYGFIATPTRADKIHMVVFVLDASTLDVLPSKLVDKIKNLQNIGRQKGIPQVLVLTQIDKICRKAITDLSVIFRSSNVENAVEKAAQTFGIPRSSVLPLKNYENEMELKADISAVALLSFRQILSFTEDYLENVLDEIEEERGDGDKVGDGK